VRRLYIKIKGDKDRSFKSKIIKAIVNHPRLVTFGIVLAVTFGVGISTGLIHQPEQAFAGSSAWRSYCKTCY